MIALIDYGSGNLKSVAKAFRKLGADIQLVQNPEKIQTAAAVVLPGVGAFGDCLAAMRRQNMEDAIKRAIQAGKPFLGICVGYQALFQHSQEFGNNEPGLGYFSGTVRKFTERPGLKIPQIGWNQLRITQPNCPLYKGIKDGSYVYFVHSFYPDTTDQTIITTQTEYGDIYASSVWRENIFGVQFHPEKSQQVGLKILQNFLELIP